MAHINTYYINCHEYLNYSPETWHFLWHSIWHSFWHSFWHSIWNSAWHSIWHWFPADILSGILSGITIWHSIWHSVRHSVWHSIWRILSDILSGIQHCSLRLWPGGWGPAGPTAIESWRRWRLRSAIESWRRGSSRFQQCPHWLRAGSWGPTVPTAIRSRKRSTARRKHGGWRRTEKGSYIKSNNPHMAGGENLTWFRDVPGMVETCLTQVPRPPKKWSSFAQRRSPTIVTNTKQKH